MPSTLNDGCWSRWASCCSRSLSPTAIRKRLNLLGTVLFADQQVLDSLILPKTERENRVHANDVCIDKEAQIVDCSDDSFVSSVSRAFSQFSVADEGVRLKPASADLTPFDEENRTLGRQLVERVADSLLRARSVTEQATLTVGQHVSQLFETARRDNDLAGKTLGGMLAGAGDRYESREGLAAIVDEQRSMIDRFVAETKACFARQVEFSSSAVNACREMERCVSVIEKLVFSSEILAFNVQVESIRLGEQGRAFSVLGEEMVRFSTQVSQANAAMQKSLDSVCDTMKRLHDESSNVDNKLGDFASSLSKRMQGVQERTENLTATLNETLQLITSSNEVLMTHSQSALSELQFQDPLAQDLLRAHHEILKIQELLTSGTCEDTSLADIDPAVGNDGRIHRDAGEVELF